MMRQVHTHMLSLAKRYESGLSILVSLVLCALEQVWAREAAHESHVEDERDPSVVHDCLGHVDHAHDALLRERGATHLGVLGKRHW